QKQESWWRRLIVSGTRTVNEREEKRKKEKNHRTSKGGYVAELPYQRPERMKFHESRILFDAENDQWRDESGKNLQQVGEKCHWALLLGGLIVCGKNGLASH